MYCWFLQMKAALLTLRTFAQACPGLVSKHILAMTPYLVDPKVADALLAVLEVLEIIIPISPSLDATQITVSLRCTRDCKRLR